MNAKEFIFLPYRKNGLKRIQRFLPRIMIHRSTDWEHSLQVGMLSEFIGQKLSKDGFFPKGFDLEKSILEGYIHDDVEMIRGDVSSYVKRKWSPERRIIEKQKDIEAIDELLQYLPLTIGKYSYKELLIDCIEKKTPETQFISYVDKVAAAFFGEVIHESLAGNKRFYQRKSSPYQRYRYEIFDKLPSELSDLSRIFDSDHEFNLLHPKVMSQFELPLHSSRIREHTKENLKRNTGIMAYDLWKNLQLKCEHSKELEKYLLQKVA